MTTENILFIAFIIFIIWFADSISDFVKAKIENLEEDTRRKGLENDRLELENERLELENERMQLELAKQG